MACLEGFVITVRTAKQGAAMEKGKHTPEYLAEIATLTLCPQDLQALALDESQKASITSDSGTVTVTCRGAEGPPGVFFLPLGATANLLIGSQTFGTGVPSYKGFSAKVCAVYE